MDGDQEKVTNIEKVNLNDRIETVKLADDSEVVIAGIKEHTTNINEIRGVSDALEKVVKEKGATNVVYLGEGSAVSAGIKHESSAIAILGGDQQAMACRAKELGIEIIDSWDMTLTEQLTAASSKLGAENALIWMLSQSSIALKAQGETINIKNTLTMLDRFGLSKANIADALDNEVVSSSLNDEDAANQFLLQHAGFSLDEVNVDETKYRMLSQVAYPENSEESVKNLPEGIQEASLVAGKLSEERDKRFKDKVNQYSQVGKTVFVSCGGGHVNKFIDVLTGV